MSFGETHTHICKETTGISYLHINMCVYIDGYKLLSFKNISPID